MMRAGLVCNCHKSFMKNSLCCSFFHCNRTAKPPVFCREVTPQSNWLCLTNTSCKMCIRDSLGRDSKRGMIMKSYVQSYLVSKNLAKWKIQGARGFCVKNEDFYKS